MPDGGDLTGIGSIASAAVDITKFLIGNNTVTNTNGSTNSATHADTTVSSESDVATDIATNTDKRTLGTVTTSGENKTATTNDVSTNTFNQISNSADPGVIAMLKQLAGTAISNSTDPSKTTGLLSGILQSAGDAMAAVFGQQKQAGVYNSASAQSVNNDILSRASADAAQAILGYKTGQQTLADTALNQLLGATSVQTTRGSSNQHTSNLVDQFTSNTVATDMDEFTSQIQQTRGQTINNVSTHAAGDAISIVNQTSKSSTKASVVCTWMYSRKMLSARRYIIVTEDLRRKTWYVQKGYLLGAAPLVRQLQRSPTSLLSKLIISLFSARTEYVCSMKGLRGCKKTLYGGVARFLIACYSASPSIYILLKHSLLSFLETHGRGVA